MIAENDPGLKLSVNRLTIGLDAIVSDLRDDMIGIEAMFSNAHPPLEDEPRTHNHEAERKDVYTLQEQYTTAEMALLKRAKADYDGDKLRRDHLDRMRNDISPLSNTIEIMKR